MGDLEQSERRGKNSRELPRIKAQAPSVEGACLYVNLTNELHFGRVGAAIGRPRGTQL